MFNDVNQKANRSTTKTNEKLQERTSIKQSMSNQEIKGDEIVKTGSSQIDSKNKIKANKKKPKYSKMYRYWRFIYGPYSSDDLSFKDKLDDFHSRKCNFICSYLQMIQFNHQKR